MSRPIALVTGASRGIGLGLATLMAQRGYNLTITSRDAQRLEAVASDLRAFGGDVQIVAADMGLDDDVQRVADEIQDRHGQLDVLILSAGVGSASPMDNYPVRRYEKQFSVNITAPFLLLRRCLPLLREAARLNQQRGAKVIAIASITALYAERGLSAYGASKAALIALCQSVNTEESDNGVSACAISPAFVDTDMAAWAHATVPPETMITVADVVNLAGAVLDLSRNAVVPHLVVQRPGAYPYRA